ncbi:helix-turn-helix transcriptional regulator [Frankia sp. CiP3]|uniref:helix-turn-helix transcriptional regulator n=1 Tax=Frankia sp. CiP3 TaxID=2880971 RepID=UPI001EF6244E|nr:helix-turn-helix transcriptional regulator [Frankia sp. CiP3]
MAESLGERVAELRVRAVLTQDEFAERAGVSLTTVRKLERGARDAVSLPTLHSFARVLGVTTSDLLSYGGPLDRDDNGDTADLAALRRVLVPVPVSPPGGDAPNIGDVRQGLIELTRMYQANRYKDALALAPGLLIAADAATGAATGDFAVVGQRLAARSYLMASLVLLQFRREDLSITAAERAIRAAEGAGDELLRASAADNIAWNFTRQARLDDAEDTALFMAEAIEPHGEVTEIHLAQYGRLLTRASSSAARNNRPAASSGYLATAKEVAGRLRNDYMTVSSFWAAFGPTTVDTIEVENAMVMGEADRALFLARRVRRGKAIRETTWQRYLLTVAEAQLATKGYAGAAKTLAGVHQVAPEWFVSQRLARRLIHALQDATSVRWARANSLDVLAQAIK